MPTSITSPQFMSGPAGTSAGMFGQLGPSLAHAREVAAEQPLAGPASVDPATAGGIQAAAARAGVAAPMQPAQQAQPSQVGQVGPVSQTFPAALGKWASQKGRPATVGGPETARASRKRASVRAKLLVASVKLGTALQARVRAKQAMRKAALDTLRKTGATLEAAQLAAKTAKTAASPTGGACGAHKATGRGGSVRKRFAAPGRARKVAETNSPFVQRLEPGQQRIKVDPEQDASGEKALLSMNQYMRSSVGKGTGMKLAGKSAAAALGMLSTMKLAEGEPDGHAKFLAYIEDAKAKGTTPRQAFSRKNLRQAEKAEKEKGEQESDKPKKAKKPEKETGRPPIPRSEDFPLNANPKIVRLLADVFGRGDWGATRAGGAETMARSIGAHTPFSVRKPRTSAALVGLLASLAGAGGGAASGLAAARYGGVDNNAIPIGALLGGVGGSVFGTLGAGAYRYRRIEELRRKYDAAVAAGRVPEDPGDPNVSRLRQLALPMGGPHRLGQAEARRTLSEGSPRPNWMRNALYTGARALGPVAPGINIATGVVADLEANAIHDQVEGREGRPGWADNRPAWAGGE